MSITDQEKLNNKSQGYLLECFCKKPRHWPTQIIEWQVPEKTVEIFTSDETK